MMHGLYVHVPFCLQKCRYCDFCSAPGTLPQMQAYVKAVLKEADIRRAALTAPHTIYIGGGTPSVLPAVCFRELLTGIRERFDLKNLVEFTVEMNPDTVTPEQLLVMKEAGVNRISMGLQAADDAFLKMLGRTHTVQGFIRAWNLLGEFGFENRNLDLIFGLPGQTQSDWEKSLRFAVDLEPAHISLYSLQLEEGTVLTRMVERGELPEPEEETDRLMYEKASDFLPAMGYERYEFSNFAKPGFESRHNNIYWNRGEYLGLGPGAHSLIGNTRLYNPGDTSLYIKEIETMGIACRVEEELTPSEAEFERDMLALRLAAGIPSDRAARYGRLFEDLAAYGLVERAGDRVRLTTAGINVSNEIFVKMMEAVEA